MAFERFFGSLSENELLERARNEAKKASTLYQRAAELAAQMHFEESLEIADSASQLVDNARSLLDRHIRFTEQFIPGIIQQLKDEYDISEPSEEFIAQLYLQYKEVAEQALEEEHETATEESNEDQTTEAQAPVQAEIPSETENKEEVTERVSDLSLAQYQSVAFRFRLSESQPEARASLDQAVREIYAEEYQESMHQGKSEQETVDEIRSKARNGWPRAVEHLHKANTLLQELLEREPRFPFSDQELDLLSHQPYIQHLFTRASQIKEYQGKTLEEIIKLTKGTRGSKRKA